jgi:hypothetical protein
MVILPAEASFSMVVPAAKLGFSTGVGLEPVPVPPPPQALSVRAIAADAAARRDFLRVKNAFMTFLSLGGRP